MSKRILSLITVLALLFADFSAASEPVWVFARSDSMESVSEESSLRSESAESVSEESSSRSESAESVSEESASRNESAGSGSEESSLRSESAESVSEESSSRSESAGSGSEESSSRSESAESVSEESSLRSDSVESGSEESSSRSDSVDDEKDSETKSLEDFGEELFEMKASDDDQDYVPVEEQSPQEQEEYAFQTGRLIVKAERPIEDAKAVSVAGPYRSIYVIQYETKEQAREACAYYQSCNWVEFVQEDRVHRGLDAGSGAVAVEADKTGSGALAVEADKTVSEAVAVEAANTASEAVAVEADKTVSEAVAVEADKTGSGALAVGADKTVSGAVAVEADKTGSGALAVEADKTVSGVVAVEADKTGSGALAVGADNTGSEAAAGNAVLAGSTAGTGSTIRAASSKNTGVGLCGFANMQKAIEEYYGDVSKVPEVTVAVIDTGIDFEHSVLKDRIQGDGYNAFTNGFLGSVLSKMVPSLLLPEDDNGHGTEVAGVIAMSTPDYVRILPVKVANAWGDMDDSDIYLGVEYAISQNADVINMSFGGDEIASITKQYLKDCDKAGVIVVSAYGNEHQETSTIYPACYGNVVGVSAVNDDLSFAKSYSNYGSKVDFSAPGTNVYTTCPDFVSTSGYTKVTGTSFSTPYVSAAAALIKALNPEASVSGITDWLIANAKDLGDKGRDDLYGYGFLCFSEASISASMQKEDSQSSGKPEQSGTTESTGKSEQSGTAGQSGKSEQSGTADPSGTSDQTDTSKASQNTEETRTTTVVQKLSAPVIKTLSTKKNGIKITWKKVSGAKGYLLYRKKKGGSWSKIKTLSGKSKVSYTDTGVKSGGKYYYRLRAYCGSTKSSYSSSRNRVYLSPTKLVSLTSAKKRATVRYQKLSQADGFQIQYSTKKDFSSGAKKITVGAIRQKTITGLKSKKTYYFRVRAFKTVGGVRYYSTWSTNIKSCRIK